MKLGDSQSNEEAIERKSVSLPFGPSIPPTATAMESRASTPATLRRVARKSARLAASLGLRGGGVSRRPPA